ncbi:MAG: MMPL family transporter [Thermoleophilaceae bacterium]|nr:MMPL family transporter [Thermoleophilaceae bacterium]
MLLLGSSALEFNDAQNNKDANYLPQSAESLKAIHLEEKAFGDELLTGLLVYQNENKLTRADKAAVLAATAQLTKQPVEGQYGKPVPLFLPDRKTAAIYFQMRAYGSKETLFDAAERLDDIAAQAPPDMTVNLTGQAGFFNDQAEIFDTIDGNLLIGTVLLISLLLLLIYRSPFLWLLPLTTVGFAEITSRGLGTELADRGATITSQSAALMTVLVFGVGTDYALLIIARYRDELRHRDDPHEAMAEALMRSGPTILASAATVIAALLCLMLADVNATSGAGPIGAMGIAIAMLSMLTLLPALLLIFGRPVFWPFVPHTGTSTEEVPVNFWSRLADLISRKPGMVTLVVFSLMAVMALGLLNRPGGLDITNSFHKPVESVAGMKVLEKALPPGATGPMTVLVSDPRQIGRVTRALKRSGDVASVSAPQPGRGAVRIEATLKYSPYSDGAIDAVDRVRDQLMQVSGGTALVSGATAVESDSRHFAAKDNKLIMPLVLLVVFLILLVLLRSLVAPLLLMITVVASFLAVMGASYWAFDNLFGYSGVDEYVPIFVFIFLVALGVDYNIFLMARVREEAAKFGAREGMRRGLIVTGGVITSAGVVLAGTFFVMAAMPMTVLTEIGFSIAIGVLFDALIVRTLMVPALGFMLGEKMWWPAHFDQAGKVAPQVAAGPPQQIAVPAEQQVVPQATPATAPPAPFETPLPDWTRIGGSSRYR